ncbi:venom allergen 5.02-like [Arctopsyche grandis]|uniref:venom allergen 5.02-like n=1 Tax=Arctopsyche grandis TaxID=121162 RepID=UPI00406D63A3
MVKPIVLVCCCLVVLFAAEAREISGSVSCDDKKIIIDKLNELRREVAEGKLIGQPKASNMNLLVWDDKLQELAQNWALQGKMAHNQNRHDDRFQVGENIYFSFDPRAEVKANWTAAAESWFAENKVYTYSKGFSMSTGHYTQVVWADTIYVGCGFSHYRENGQTTGTYVCNFGPAGNFADQYPYETGTGCEELCCTEQCGKLYGDECN